MSLEADLRTCDSLTAAYEVCVNEEISLRPVFSVKQTNGALFSSFSWRLPVDIAAEPAST